MSYIQILLASKYNKGIEPSLAVYNHRVLLVYSYKLRGKDIVIFRIFYQSSKGFNKK